MAIIGESPIDAGEPDNVLQSFSDATAGRSLQLYHCVGTIDSVGTDYVLVRDSGTSSPTQTAGNFDIDFDITINKPTIVAGIATIDVNFKHMDTSGGDNALIVFTLRKFDGATETDIGTVTTQAVLESASTTSDKLQFVVTRTKLNIGDTLRLTADAGGSDNRVRLFHDPGTAGNELKLWVPLVVS